MKQQFYRVGDFTFCVSMPHSCRVQELLPTFAPFATAACREEERLFGLNLCGRVTPPAEAVAVEESSDNALRISLSVSPTAFWVELGHPTRGPLHRLAFDPCATRFAASVDLADPNAGFVASTLLRIAFSQAILPHGGLSLHASAVTLERSAYLFLGKSGTGKSTHAALWRRFFAGCSLLNDDNPIVRIDHGKVWAYGSPWSGKIACYKNARAQVGGIARLRQAECNRFERLAGAEAFAALLPSCSAAHHSAQLQQHLMRSVAHIAGSNPVGLLACRPDEEAARLCRKNLDVKKKL